MTLKNIIKTTKLTTIILLLLHNYHLISILTKQKTCKF